VISFSLIYAQAPADPLSAGQKMLYTNGKNNLIRSAEKMPEENYSFKPVPEVRSFGQIIGHVADAQYLFCSAVLGEKNPAPNVEKTKTTKAELVQALKDAFAYSDKAYDAMTDAQAAQMIKFFGQDRAKLTVLSFNNVHNMEHYGNLVTYLRIKGLVPPSSEPRK
jgi:uncharacterized damage-inducible protein DinB